jgi:hypothetical protein
MIGFAVEGGVGHMCFQSNPQARLVEGGAEMIGIDARSLIVNHGESQVTPAIANHNQLWKDAISVPNTIVVASFAVSGKVTTDCR